ncbi:MAG TPA: hypothetical protein VMT64_06715, partial [Candidatus Binataceae bacterium]|nr:hypothetical protein [Candidatus Binataceae bacterium]
ASSRAIAMGAGAMGTGGLGGLEVSGVSPDTGPSGDRAIDGMGRHMEMGSHMRMTESRAITPADVARGQQIIRIMREELSKYQDYRVAEAAGYLPYMETVPQDVYHFTNRALTGAEWLGDVDLKRPGSLLYERNSLDGYRLVGAMYSAPANYTTEQLDRIVPVSLTAWHQHVNICLPAGITEDDVMNGRIAPRVTAASIGAGRHLDPRLGYLGDPRFGFVGTISDEAACAAVGGNFHPLIFGWMVHVYPFAGTDDLKIAFGMDAP